MPEMKFSASVRQESGAAVIDLKGDINGSADAALSSTYTEAESTDPACIALNFSGVNYINSTGIALIVGLLARARKARRRLSVYGLSPHYQEIFQITRLADFMSIYADEAGALAVPQS